ncbi:unnamed protein product [Rhizoctonia solani]|uniref:F-box domain-containing protein n=1 Tax=Rhizoctonia solani TaxID=456999 RepID=A0A8H2X3K0_9AGAM|nr:unnamed protein product [Rhizoctonia solani]
MKHMASECGGSETQQPHKKQAGNLEKFIHIPMDIFTEIASHLFPIDIISLSHSSKLFRNLLMRRSSRHIWVGAMRNVQGLPPCPFDMSEPRYLVLLFSKYCTGCGQTITYGVYQELRMRLCIPCRNVHLVTLNSLPLELKGLLHKGATRPKSPSRCIRPYPTLYTIKEEVNEIEEKVKELEQAGDQVALEAWKNKRKKAVHARETVRVVVICLDIDN